MDIGHNRVQLPNPVEKVKTESKHTRRNVLITAGAVALGGTIFGRDRLSGGSGSEKPAPAVAPVDTQSESQPEETAVSYVAEVEDEAQVDQGEAPLLAFSSTPNLYANLGLGDYDPKMIRESRESNALGFSRSLRIMEEEVSVPEDLPKVVVDRLMVLSQAGKDEIPDYLPLGADPAEQDTAKKKYIARMREKYLHPFIEYGLGQDAVIREGRQIEAIPAFVVLSEYQENILGHAWDQACATGNLDAITAISIVNQEKTRVVGETYAHDMTIRISNEVGIHDPTKNYYDAEGPIYFQAEPVDGVIRVYLSDDERYAVPFNELSAQI